MKAVVVEHFGAPGELTFREWAWPAVKAGEVLVEVHAAGLNFPDVLVAGGKYQTLPPLPFVPGKELAGIVTAVGEGVPDFKPGDRVLCQCENGAFAELVAVRQEDCCLLPDNLPMVKAAAMGLTYQTAWFGLMDRAHLKPGETVLVTGAGGGVGTAAMQIAKAQGCRVLAGLGSMEKRDFVLSLGADAVIDMSGSGLHEGVRRQVHDATGGHGADVVIENVGGAVFGACLRALAWAGRLVVVGFTSGEIPLLKANYLLIKHITVTGLHWSDYRERMPEAVRKAQEELFHLARMGKIDPPISAVMPMEEVAAGMGCILQRKVRGKVVLITEKGRAAGIAITGKAG
ncbi:MAG: NADPH:quinone oxidoreductase family protein [Rhizobiaceae bacterium]